ncbi:hypothetical protein SDC9_139058 [bioreactor metagenome]|uniref:Uncharacterized protein n=1 Tax=bioreactor metagenome TaxID=1076179 RepID=A0A645DR35_9ZZZZ
MNGEADRQHADQRRIDGSNQREQQRFGHDIGCGVQRGHAQRQNRSILFFGEHQRTAEDEPDHQCFKADEDRCAGQVKGNLLRGFVERLRRNRRGLHTGELQRDCFERLRGITGVHNRSIALAKREADRIPLAHGLP